MIVHPDYPPTLGATLIGPDRCRFLVWAPHAKKLELKITGPTPHVFPMQRLDRGYYELTLDGVGPGTEYFYRIDGQRDRPDPASRLQPHGVHQASAVVDRTFAWTDEDWHGIPLRQYIIYELHVGTFTTAGTFDAAIEQLDDLCELGITAIELMPITQFPGGRNWGYDGVQPFAVQNTYGGPDGLKRLVNAAHKRGLAVILDVVYNHLGPEGNYLPEFGQYFTNRYVTPWGSAMNFDDLDCDEVRRYFIENALYWIDECHIDALRLDAVHAIYDFSARPFLQELAAAIHLEGERLNRRVYTIAESGQNDPKLLTPSEVGGWGLDAQWADDLHHALRSTLVHEHSGYYMDYEGFSDIVKAYRDGFVLDGRHSKFLRHRHGRSVRDIEPYRLVVCSQNHDQVGNRLMGERLTALASFEQQKLAAATVLLSPCLPMLFMGEEYGEPAPFQFFISHLDENLVAAVRRGRKHEFASFRWKHEPPDPQAEETFQRCQLNHTLKQGGHHRVLREFYRALIQLRMSETSLTFPDRDRMTITSHDDTQTMIVEHCTAGRKLLLIFHFGAAACELTLTEAPGTWTLLLDSADPRWQGPGSELRPGEAARSTSTLHLMPFSIMVHVQPQA
ncbi:malto-oligosyltrehalose trehalohydrolase [bacterium]|nr:malto-oligosyltrehalose trehalohydrolase [bacterium]